MPSEDVKGRYGLKWQFRTVLLIALIFLILILIAGELVLPAFLVWRAEDNSVALASVASMRLGQALRQNAAGAEQLAALPGIVTMDPGQQTPVMAMAETTNPEIKEMFILNADGVLTAALPDHPSYAAGRNFGNADYFRQAVETGKPYFSDVFIEGKDVEIIVATPIKQADGTTSGTLNSILSMSIGIVPDYLKNLKIGISGYAVVVDRRGTLVWHPDANRMIRQENVRSFQSVKNVVAGESGGEAGGLGGDNTITGYVPVKSTGLGVLIVRPINEAVPDLTAIRITFGIICLIGLVLVLLMYWHGYGVVINPLRQITEGVEQASHGDLDHDIEVKRPREMAELAASFNQMVKVTAAFNDVSRTLNSLTDLGEIERYVLNRMDKIFQTEASAIVRFNDQGRLRIHASRGFPEERVQAHNLRDTDMEGMIYMFGKKSVNSLEKGKNVLLETNNVKALKTIAPDDTIRYVYLFPLLVEKKLDGVLMAMSSSEKPFTDERVRLVSGLVDQVSAAVHRSDLFERLYQSYAQTTKAIAKAIDAKDPYNQGHSEGVAGIAVKIARKMGLSLDAVHGVEIAAYLHDVGKIGISENLLNKPAQLSEEERDMIKLHPILGVHILEPIDFPWPVLAAVEHHHERFDGSGYPDSLSGEKIPIEGRILAVADAYESMANDRPYRSALDRDEIEKEFAKESGRQFDAGVVAALLAIIQEERDAEPQIIDESAQEQLEGMPDIETVEVPEDTGAEETVEAEEVEGQEVLPLSEETEETEETEEEQETEETEEEQETEETNS
jgi:putative nucleotidyltransferase with HDIG domain